MESDLASHRLTIRDVEGPDEGTYSAALKGDKISAQLSLKGR